MDQAQEMSESISKPGIVMGVRGHCKAADDGASSGDAGFFLNLEWDANFPLQLWAPGHDNRWQNSVS